MNDGIGPQFARVAIDGVIGLLTAFIPDIVAEMGRPAFTRFGRAFRGQAMAAPEAWVTPVNTVMDDEGQTRHQISELVVTLGLVGGDPEATMDAALDYVRAVDLAISRNETGLEEPIKRVFVREHNYGALRTKGTGFAVFPEVFVLVEMEEEG